MIVNYLHDDIIEFMIGEVTFLTELGETADSAISRIRQDLHDCIDVATAAALILRRDSQKGAN